MKLRETRLYVPFTSRTKFHTPHVHAKKKRETCKGLLPNKNQALSTFYIININYFYIIKLNHKLLFKL